MAGNTQPIFSAAPALTGAATGIQILLTAAMTQATAFNGTDANALLAFTAGANGSFIQKIRFKPYCTSGSSAAAATVCRVFINNGGTIGTATNNTFIGEISLPAFTYSATAAQVELDYPINFALPAGYKIYLGLGTAPANNNGWQATVIAGNY